MCVSSVGRRQNRPLVLVIVLSVKWRTEWTVVAWQTLIFISQLLFSWGSRITHRQKCNVAYKQLPIKNTLYIGLCALRSLCICEVQLCMFLWQKRLHLTLLSSAAHRFNILSPISAFTADDVLRPSIMEPICVLNWLWRVAAQVMSPLWFLLFCICHFLHFVVNTYINSSLVHLSRYQSHLLLWRRVCVKMFQLWILISVQISARLSMYNSVIFDWLSRVLLV